MIKWIFFILFITVIPIIVWVDSCIYSRYIINDAFCPLSTEIIGSFLLAFFVFLVGIKIENDWREKVHKNKLDSDLNLLKKVVLRVFKRSESNWNFNNITSSFYLDKSRINHLYDIFVHDGRRWENMLLDFKNTNKTENDFVETLLDFIEEYDDSIIIAEKMDKILKKKAIVPYLEAAKASHYAADVEQADTRQRFSFLIFRALLFDIAESEIISGLAEVQGATSIHNRVQMAQIEFKEFLKDKQLSQLAKDLISLKKRLLNKVQSIEDKVTYNK